MGRQKLCTWLWLCMWLPVYGARAVYVAFAVYVARVVCVALAIYVFRAVYVALAVQVIRVVARAGLRLELFTWLGLYTWLWLYTWLGLHSWPWLYTWPGLYTWPWFVRAPRESHGWVRARIHMCPEPYAWLRDDGCIRGFGCMQIAIARGCVRGRARGVREMMACRK